jgi:hypothetical protein
MLLAAVPSEINGYAGDVKNQISILNPHIFSGQHATRSANIQVN